MHQDKLIVRCKIDCECCIGKSILMYVLPVKINNEVFTVPATCESFVLHPYFPLPVSGSVVSGKRPKGNCFLTLIGCCLYVVCRGGCITGECIFHMFLFYYFF